MVWQNYIYIVIMCWEKYFDTNFCQNLDYIIYVFAIFCYYFGSLSFSVILMIIVVHTPSKIIFIQDEFAAFNKWRMIWGFVFNLLWQNLILLLLPINKVEGGYRNSQRPSFWPSVPPSFCQSEMTFRATDNWKFTDHPFFS